jgi:hypothetical protein
MNGMGGVPIDREEVGSIGQRSYEAAKAVIRAWLIEKNGEAYGTDVLYGRNSGLCRMAWPHCTWIVLPHSILNAHKTV